MSWASNVVVRVSLPLQPRGATAIARLSKGHALVLLQCAGRKVLREAPSTPPRALRRKAAEASESEAFARSASERSEAVESSIVEQPIAAATFAKL